MLTALLGFALKALLPTLGTMVTAAVMAVLKRYFAKLGLELSAANEARVRDLVAQALLQVEEMARRRAGQGSSMSGQEKADMAIDLLRRKLPELGADDISELIDAELPKVRAAIVAPTVPPAPAS